MEEKLVVSDPSKIEITKVGEYVIHFDYEGKHYFIKECNDLYCEDDPIMILFSKVNDTVNERHHRQVDIVHCMQRGTGSASCVENLTGNVKHGVPYSKFAAFGYLDTFVKNCKDDGLFC